MPGLYTCIETDITALFAAGWVHSDVPVYWRADDADPRPDPGEVPHWLRNAIDLGPERLMGFGGGNAGNLRAQFGMVSAIGFTARSDMTEGPLLDLLSDAAAALRSRRVAGTYPPSSELSFIGDGTHFDIDPQEAGGWFVRGMRIAFEYRFIG